MTHEEPDPDRWRAAWRQGITPKLSDRALAALRDGLAANDPRLIQGANTVGHFSPLATTRPRSSRATLPVAAACPLGFCGWIGDGLETVGEVEEYFADLINACDCIGLFAGRWFTCWFDETERSVAFPALLAEVTAEIARRKESTP